MNYGVKWNAEKKVMTMTRSQSQINAEQRYYLTRKGKARIPCLYIEPEENKLLCDLAEVHGSKKAAIMAGLHLLAEQDKKNEESKAG